jgi:Protein of unknown function (DUF2971)
MTTLYHYCTASTFHSIIARKSIWLSSLSMSNDAMEGKLISDIMNKMALDDGLDSILFAELNSALAAWERIVDGLGICLSKEGDLLSQWRGYAGDAAGFSIGFDHSYLRELANSIIDENDRIVQLKEMRYDNDVHKDVVKKIYEEIKKELISGPLKGPVNAFAIYASEEAREAYEKDVEAARLSLIQNMASRVVLPLYTLKNPGFAEEREWRLLAIVFGLDGCSFRAAANKIIPYQEYTLLTLSKPGINRVILGPKNPTPIRVVERFLKSNGFESVEVLSSKLTYR